MIIPEDIINTFGYHVQTQILAYFVIECTLCKYLFLKENILTVTYKLVTVSSRLSMT